MLSPPIKLVQKEKKYIYTMVFEQNNVSVLELIDYMKLQTMS